MSSRDMQMRGHSLIRLYFPRMVFYLPHVEKLVMKEHFIRAVNPGKKEY